jgi:hypothetical protein
MERTAGAVVLKHLGWRGIGFLVRLKMIAAVVGHGG